MKNDKEIERIDLHYKNIARYIASVSSLGIFIGGGIAMYPSLNEAYQKLFNQNPDFPKQGLNGYGIALTIGSAVLGSIFLRLNGRKGRKTIDDLVQ